MKSARHSHSGFTLIEIVIAISLLAAIIVILYGALSGIIASKKLLDDRRDGTAIASAILTRMTRELQLAYPQHALMPPQNDPDKRYPARVSFLGERKELGDHHFGDSITFLALEGGQYLPDGGTHSGLVQISYRVEKNPDEPEKKGTYYLVRQETPYTRPFDRAYKKTMIFPVTTSLVSLKFKYFSNDTQEWTPNWDESKTMLPSVVEFTVVIMTPAGHEESFTTSVALRSKSS
jgi:prepilin-type N-terminal cleavage/methylation domain-containing protein